ncbi:hypothetical protein F5Y10DRAFT_289010 [Nemania abortiva]|nr:hypothetical protein F5Y10DRAFT_289010 [Nemania abortiva]
MSKLQVTSPGSPTSSFPQFTRLPLELRIEIWEIAMDEPRAIHLLSAPDGHIQRTLMINDVKFVDVPVFFFVNRECRGIVVNQYSEIKAHFKARTDIPGHSFPSLELNLLIKDGDKLEFNGILPCYTVFPLEIDQPVRVRWEYPQGPYAVPQANCWLESLPSGCNNGEAEAFPDSEMSCTMDIRQQKPPYFAFDMAASDEPVWTCVLVESREEILDKFTEWEHINLLPHLLAWMRTHPGQSPLDNPLQ